MPQPLDRTQGAEGRLRFPSLGQTNDAAALEDARAEIAREDVGLAEVEQQDTASDSVVERSEAHVRERSGRGLGWTGCERLGRPASATCGDSRTPPLTCCFGSGSVWVRPPRFPSSMRDICGIGRARMTLSSPLAGIARDGEAPSTRSPRRETRFKDVLLAGKRNVGYTTSGDGHAGVLDDAPRRRSVDEHGSADGNERIEPLHLPHPHPDAAVGDVEADGAGPGLSLRPRRHSRSSTPPRASSGTP